MTTASSAPAAKTMPTQAGGDQAKASTFKDKDKPQSVRSSNIGKFLWSV